MKQICFTILKSYSFNKVEKKLSEAESAALKCIIELKDLIIQKAGEDNTIVVTERTRHVEKIKSLLSDSSNFMQFLNDELSG